MLPRDVVVAVVVSPQEFLLIRECLSQDGIQVRPARGLEEVLGQRLASAPLVLYDSEGYEGWREALRRLASRWPACQFVVLSRAADERMWMEVLEAGGYDLLVKPLRPTEIRQVVRAALAA